MGLKRKCTRDMNSLEEVRFTRSRKKDSLPEMHPSAITEHVAQTNHIIYWGSIKLPMKKDTWITRRIKESISIRKGLTPRTVMGVPPAFRGLLQVAAIGAIS